MSPTAERGRSVKQQAHPTSSPTRLMDAPRTGDGYAGNSSNVVAARPGSAKPRTHFSDAFVLYFSA